MARRGILLVNLGSPDSTEVGDVRRYLREFLSDPRVLDAPWPVRAFVLNAFILPFRPKASAEAYKTIWTPDGSPLVASSQRLAALLQERVTEPVALAMRYGRPSIDQGVAELVQKGAEEIFLVPLYPHYAMSSYETVVARVQEVVAAKAPHLHLAVQPPFFEDPDYIDALVQVARPHLDAGFDHLLFSYHGIPERHLKLRDPSGCYCLASPTCCDNPNPVHGVCYRAQCFRTMRLFIERAQIDPERCSISFQSRLGRDPWLKPYTDHVLEDLPKRGVKRLLVMCPAFVTDCLETLEEIQERGKESFLHAGGQDFAQIPCLNEHPRWVEVLTRFVQDTRPSA